MMIERTGRCLYILVGEGWFFSKADPHFLRQSLSKPIFSHSPSEISRLVAIITGKAVETTKRRQLSTFSAHLLTRHFLQ